MIWHNFYESKIGHIIEKKEFQCVSSIFERCKLVAYNSFDYNELINSLKNIAYHLKPDNREQIGKFTT